MAATPAVVKKLIDELIGAVTGITLETDPDNFQICHDYALQRIKNHTFVRTNPFDVTRTLDGLEERFSVVCKDDLAYALRSRLNELKACNFNWSSEVLSLLLHLSYRPIDNAKLSDLEGLEPPPSPKPLTWEDILAEDPLEDGELWDPIDYGRDSDLSSLEDEEMVDVVEEDDEMARVTLRRKKESGEEADEEEVRPLDCFTVPVDWSVLKPLKGAQYWYVPNKAIDRQVDSSLSIDQVDDLWLVSELHAIRETIFMLSGVHCNLYEVGKRTLTTGKDPTLVWIDTHKLKKKFALRHASRDGLISVLGWFAERGTAINKIREFVRRKEDAPARQSFAAALDKTLGELNSMLSRIETTFVTKGEAQVISLLKLQQTLEKPLIPYMHLSNIVSELVNKPPSSNASFSAHLDLLFNTSCLLQSIGDLASFQFHAKIFFQCLQTYLRPIREWMESGHLRPNDSTFFVTKIGGGDEDDVNLGSLWHDQYELTRDEQGNVTAPRFVSKEAANTIFTTGKSVVFLKRLMGYEPPPAPEVGSGVLEIGWDTIFPAGATSVDEEGVLELAPFDELFASAFGDWTRHKHHSASARLRDALFESCGLEKALNAIEVVYMGSDGAKASMLAAALFDRIDKSNTTSSSSSSKKQQQPHQRGRSRTSSKRQKRGVAWNDRFVLTELVQSIFSGEGSPVDTKRLSVRKVDVLDIDLDLDGDHNLASPTHHKPSKSQNTSTTTISPSKTLEGIEFEYALPWPLQNILPPARFSIFKRLYTFLLQLRRAKHVLEQAHIYIQILPLPPSNRYSRNPAHAGKHAVTSNGCTVESNYVLVHLRHRLLWFTNTVVAYLMYHVLHPQRTRLDRELRAARDVDGLVGVVEGWAGRVEEMALLGRGLGAFRRGIGEIVDLAVEVGGWVVRRASEEEGGGEDVEGEGGGVSLLPHPVTPRKSGRGGVVGSSHSRSRSRRRRKRQRRGGAGGGTTTTDEDDDSYDDYDHNDDDDESTLYNPDSDPDHDSDVSMFHHSVPNLTKRQKEDLEIREMDARFLSLLEFLRNGLRGVSRAGVLPHLEVLAEGLEAGREAWGAGGGPGFTARDWEE